MHKDINILKSLDQLLQITLLLLEVVIIMDYLVIIIRISQILLLLNHTIPLQYTVIL